MNKIQTVVSYYKDKEKLSYRNFSDALNRYIKDGGCSYQAVKDWIDGKYDPRLGVLLQILRYSRSEQWQFKMATQLVEIIEENLEIK